MPETRTFDDSGSDGLQREVREALGETVRPVDTWAARSAAEQAEDAGADGESAAEPAAEPAASPSADLGASQFLYYTES